MGEIILTRSPDDPHAGTDVIHVRAPFALKDAIKELPAREWLGPPKHADGPKVWAIPATPTALLDFHRRFGSHVMQMDADTAAILLAAREHAKAATFKQAEGLPDMPTKTSAWGHQRQGYHFGLAMDAVYEAMDMGTGKSLTAIGLLEGWGAQVAVILGPRRALPVWPLQFSLHASRDWHVIVPPAGKSTADRAKIIGMEVVHGLALGKPIAVCCNYEAYWRDSLYSALEKIAQLPGPRVLIFDEMHRIKAPGGRASKKAAVLAKRFHKRVGLSGTPTPHSPLDIYAQYRALDPAVFGTSFQRFRGRYAIMGGFEGRQVVGYQNEEELARRMGSIMFVCKSDEVLDLPEYHHTEERCELEPSARRMYNQLHEDYMTVIPDDPGETVTTDNALTHLLRLQQCSAGWIKDDDGQMHRVSTAKQELLEDVLTDLWGAQSRSGSEGGTRAPLEPLVVFGRFHGDLDVVWDVAEKFGARCGELSGREPETVRGAPNPRYALNANAQMRDDLDVVCVQIQAGGVGIDLTRARYAIYYSMGYSLGDYEQSLKRVHRPGQDRPVTYIHLVASGTKDEAVYAALTERKNVVESIIALAREDKGQM
jgi:hypothetical protein